MKAKVRGLTLEDLNPTYTGTATPYQMAYLSVLHKKTLGLPRTIEYAIRIDGKNASLVKITGDYTSWRATAEILTD